MATTAADCCIYIIYFIIIVCIRYINRHRGWYDINQPFLMNMVTSIDNGGVGEHNFYVLVSL
jgi:hypothetical protein